MADHSFSLSDLPKTLFSALIDIIYPPACPVCGSSIGKQGICGRCTASFRRIESPLCTRCGIPFMTEGDEDHLCGTCIRERVPFDRAASVCFYDGALSEAIRRLKYSKRSSLASSLGDLLASHPVTSEDCDVIVPVPLHMERLKERGFNQSHLLAKRAANGMPVEVNPYILERTRPTLAQAGMNSRERIINIRGAIRVREGADVKGKNILLIDDVYTTGATVRECSRVLKKGGAKKVNVLTLARVVE